MKLQQMILSLMLSGLVSYTLPGYAIDSVVKNNPTLLTPTLKKLIITGTLTLVGISSCYYI
jgi:hypothetical protein